MRWSGKLITMSVLMSVIALCPDGKATADMVYINSSLVTLSGGSTTVGNAKYRLSNNNFDQSIDNAQAVLLAADQVTSNWGNVSSLSGQTFNFSLEHRTGQGFILTLLNTSNSTLRTVSWGSFASSPGGTNAATLNGIAPGAAFNSLQVESRASLSGSSMSFSNLNFTGLSVADGVFSSGTTTPTTGSPLGFDTQRLVADVNLASFNWTLTGSFQGTKLSTGSDEGVRFLVRFQQVTPTFSPLVDLTATPEPSSLILTSCVAAIVAGVTLSRRKRTRAS